MPVNRIASVLSLRHRYARSVHVGRDLADRKALDGYVVTEQVKDSLRRLLLGLDTNSTQRAWRVTGDYGTGKSSFALALAKMVSNSPSELPQDLRRQAAALMPRNRHGKLVPVVAVGSRAPLSEAIKLALAEALRTQFGGKGVTKLLARVQNQSTTQAGDDLMRLLSDAAAFVRNSGKASGLLIVLDELGKFLEFTAQRPEQQDIHVLQQLAELAARSGSTPIFVVGILHQGFTAYASHVSDLARREWEKVAGRYDEVLFNQPLEQVAELVTHALGVDVTRLSTVVQRRAKSAMQSAIDLGWFGPLANRPALLALAPRLYPLHPTVVPVAARLFARFGQNERSLLSFLLSEEPFAVRSFAENPLGEFFTLAHLYDYARAVMSVSLAGSSYRSHWNLIDSLITSFPAEDPRTLCILKAVGILNLVDDQSMLATDSAVDVAIGGWEENERDATLKAVITLQRGKRVLYNRGSLGGLCLWPYTSVNIEAAYQAARAATSLPVKIAPLLQSYLDVGPIVARRHYIETGNFRVFSVSYVGVAQLSERLSKADTTDGEIFVVTPETAEERTAAIELATGPALETQSRVLVAVTQPLSTLHRLLGEVQAWEWVAANTPELGGDAFASEEVSRQLRASRRVVSERVRDLAGIGLTTASSRVDWFRLGQILPIRTGMGVVSYLSEVCDELYPLAPRVKHELLNRNTLSSAAAAARLRLIERLLGNAAQPHLGLDVAKSPPERSMYRSVLERGRIHRRSKSGWVIAEPSPQGDPLNLRPAFAHIRHLLGRSPDSRVTADHIIRELASPPFGVRRGLSPLLIAVVLAAEEDDIAVYENGVFLQRVTGYEFQRLIKAPDTFTLQLCKIAGVRGTVFRALLTILGAEAAPEHEPTLLDVVRPLCVFASKLPQYSLKTRQVDDVAQAVRSALVEAREPATLLFSALPKACGFQPFLAAEQSDEARARAFAASLRTSIEELRTAYPRLLEAIRAELFDAFEFASSGGVVRTRLADSAQTLMVRVTDIRLKGFCLRLTDRNLADTEWIEAMGSFVCSKPPAKWTDLDVEFFKSEVGRLAAMYRRVEATTFDKNAFRAAAAIRVAVTLPDGTDVSQVLHVAPDEEPRARELQEIIAELIRSDGRIALTAASRAIQEKLNATTLTDDPAVIKTASEITHA